MSTAVAPAPTAVHSHALDPETPPLFVIAPTRGHARVDWHELWHYRDLLYFLTWREISIRYKQTVLGFLWAIVQPLMTMVVFTVFLGNLAKVPSDGVPYPIFSYLGLLPWTYFANAVSRSGSSLVGNANLLSKVYFPRLLIPISGAVSALVDFGIAFGILLALMAWYRVVPSFQSFLLVPLVVLTMLAALGVGMWLSALNVQYRDVQHAVPFLVQLWMFATPVVYPASVVSPKWRPLFALNPMTGVIEAYRSSVLGRPIDWTSLGISTSVIFLFLGIGFTVFRRMERRFADVV
ncbi:MAG: putative polysaccharide transporter permease protein [Gemmatimonadetes bacterium]|nr:putative polysaccharide transporter permease protein [Gemmatimonadota bacterium]